MLKWISASVIFAKHDISLWMSFLRNYSNLKETIQMDLLMYLKSVAEIIQKSINN